MYIFRTLHGRPRGKIESYVKYLRVQYNHKLEKYASIMWLRLIITGEVFQLRNIF